MTNEERQKFLKSILQGNLVLDEIGRRYGFPESTPESISKNLGLPLEPLRALHEYNDSGTLEPPSIELQEQTRSLVKTAIEKWGTDEERKRLL